MTRQLRGWFFILGFWLLVSFGLVASAQEGKIDLGTLELESNQRQPGLRAAHSSKRQQEVLEQIVQRRFQEFERELIRYKLGEEKP